jgi:hypothetical protein
MSGLRSLCIVAVLLAAPSVTVANEIFASQPKTVVTQMQALGYRALIGTDSSGNPKIDSALNGINYTIWFYGCDAGQNCQTLEFQSSFITDVPVTVDSMNTWNRDNLYGTGFVGTDGSAMISYTVTMEGGVNIDNFNSMLARWETATTQFQTHIGF